MDGILRFCLLFVLSQFPATTWFGLVWFGLGGLLSFVLNGDKLLGVLDCNGLNQGSYGMMIHGIMDADVDADMDMDIPAFAPIPLLYTNPKNNTGK
jgi:hypothetical protein